MRNPVMAPLNLLCLLCLLAACGSEQGELVVLFDMDLEHQIVDPVYGPMMFSPPGLHRLDDGWAPPGADAILALGPASWNSDKRLCRKRRL